jgi:hypothetical protein
LKEENIGTEPEGEKKSGRKRMSLSPEQWSR